jgi:lipoprotein-anchoring transpeptidase ErfK/SrfK
VFATAAAGVSPAAAQDQNVEIESDYGTLSGPPVMAIVSIKDQRVSLYDAEGGSIRSPVSSGAGGYETPVGTYSILQKNREHYSNVYDDAAMPFMQRITWSGIALHEGQLPGYPA